MKMLDLGGHRFPGLWRDLLPEEFLWLTPPREQRATCHDCFMVALGDFDAGCQCCTYHPQVANFMVGLALKDPESREAMEQQIAAGGALPRELVGAPGRFRESIALHAADRYGRDPEAVCPFFDQRTTHCQIYPYRNSVCATFTCAHDHGEAGEYYWDRLQQLVGTAEQAVAQWAMEQLGFPHDAYVDGLNALADGVESCTDPATGTWSIGARRSLWGDHLGREVEFFVQCADLVLENRADLFSIARDTRLRQAVVLEQAIRDWIPAELQEQVPTIADDEYGAEPVSSLLYKLQLAARSLWQLPFGEAPVALAAGASIGENAGTDRLSEIHRDCSHVVRLGADRLFLHPPEARALGVFEQPQVLDEDLMERPEITALPRPRESLAAWLRRGFLVSQEG